MFVLLLLFVLGTEWVLYHCLDSLNSITTALIFFIWTSIVSHIIPSLQNPWMTWQYLAGCMANFMAWWCERYSLIFPTIYPTSFPNSYTYQLYWAYLFTWMYECSTLSVALLPLCALFVFFICTSFPLVCLFLCIHVSFLESKLKCQFSEAFPRTYCQTKLICRSSTP